jgi:hypothetical protein
MGKGSNEPKTWAGGVGMRHWSEEKAICATQPATAGVVESQLEGLRTRIKMTMDSLLELTCNIFY